MIKKGYNIHITSWENDGDFYNTKVKVIQTQEEAKFYLEWLNIFGSRHNWKDRPAGLGNEMGLKYDGDVMQSALAYTNELRIKYDLEVWSSVEEFWDESCDVLGSSEFYDFRVFERAEVYYIEQDLNPINLDEVTEILPDRICDTCKHYKSLAYLGYDDTLGCAIAAGLVCDVYGGNEDKWIKKEETNVQ